MKVSRAVVAGVLAGLLALASIRLWPGSPDERAVHAGEVGVDATAAEEAPAGTRLTRSPAGKGLPALPPEDMPIDLAAPVLAAHARAGHGRAACRLAYELFRCQYSLRMDSLRDFRSDSAERLASTGDLKAAIRKEERNLAIAESANACRKVDPLLQQEALARLSQAARARIPYAMYLYATGEHYRFREMGFAATPEFDEWRRSAPGMMIAARDAGIPEAAAFLADAYSQDIGLAYALFPDDPVQANTHWQLQSLLGSGTTTRPFPFMFERLDPAQERESLQRAHQLHEAAFDSGIFPDLSRTDMPYSVESYGSMAASDCQGPPPRVPMTNPRQTGD